MLRMLLCVCVFLSFSFLFLLSSFSLPIFECDAWKIDGAPWKSKLGTVGLFYLRVAMM
jgi:hypothetical protein